MVLAGSAGALDLPDVLERIDQTSEIAEAEAALGLARAELDLARFAGAISFGLQPGVTVSTPEIGPIADEIKLSGSASVSAPVGLSDAQIVSVEKAAAAVMAAERALELETLTAELEKERERLLFLEDVVTLQVRAKYQQDLLTQGAAEQSARMHEHAQSNLELVQERFRQDRATQLDVVSAETQLVRAETQLTIARAKEQEAKLALAAYSGYLPELWQ